MTEFLLTWYEQIFGLSFHVKEFFKIGNPGLAWWPYEDTETGVLSSFLFCRH